MSSKRLLIVFSAIIALLMVAGAVSFVRYAREHAPNPALVAVAPFDIFVPGLEPWRVRLAEGLTQELQSQAPLSAVPQAVVRERWQGESRPELGAVDLARRTSAGVAVYGRLDPVAGKSDSLRVQMIAIAAGTGRVVVSIDRRWPVAELASLARVLADQVRRDYRYPSD
ncbi:MAG TPA: hypothetical protein VL549_11025 [Gemmatimonadales bacterium]|jgi:hypothetical protein|nr:hypothetical protein [Gemmatimonadales bacterium]